MNILRFLALLAVGWFCWRTFRGIQRSKDPKERSLAVRGAVAFWILGAMFVGAMLALPAKASLLLAIPLVLVMGSAWKAYRNSQREIRESANLKAKLERMKRVN